MTIFSQKISFQHKWQTIPSPNSLFRPLALKPASLMGQGRLGRLRLANGERSRLLDNVYIVDNYVLSQYVKYQVTAIRSFKDFPIMLKAYDFLMVDFVTTWWVIFASRNIEP